MSHLDQQIRYAFHTYSQSLFKSDHLLFSTGLNEQLSMTATAKQHWLEAVKIAAKAFLAVHKMPPAQQTITQFFSSAPAHAATRGTLEQSCHPIVLDATEHVDLALTTTQSWSTLTIDITEMPPLMT
eukprot:15345623-Ditylum_brightwellii.AAC.1